METRLVALLNTHAKVHAHVHAHVQNTSGRTPILTTRPLLTTRSDRVAIIRWLCFVEPRGFWADKDSKSVGLDPITKKEAIAAAAAFLAAPVEEYAAPPLPD